MNCCDENGKCTQGPDCPVRAERAKREAEEAEPGFWRDLLIATAVGVLCLLAAATIILNHVGEIG